MSARSRVRWRSALLGAALGLLGPTATPTASAAATQSSLEYVEVVTGGARPDDPLPLVVLLHGRGGGIAQLRHELERMPVPMRIVLPRGPVPVAGNRRAWFDERVGQGRSARLATTVADATDDLSGLIEQLRRSRPTCGKPVVVGWSQGGALAFSLALHQGQDLARAVVVGGSVPEALMPRHADPHPAITVLHGTADARVPFERTRRIVRRLDELGYSVDLHPYPGVAHQLAPAMRRELRGLVADEALRLRGQCPARSPRSTWTVAPG